MEPCKKITLRPAINSDEHILFEWQQDPNTRLYARNPNPPSFHDHRVWFRKHLESDQTTLFMGENDKQIVSTISLAPMDKVEDMEVSLVVAPKARGQGFSVPTLLVLQAYRPDLNIWAFIKPDNSVSLRSFLRAGFAHKQGDWYLLTLQVDK